MFRDEIIAVFDVFRQEFDDHNDRRERIIKLSREVTNLSKKVIFLLHRLASEEAGDEYLAISSAVRQSQGKFHEIKQVFQQISQEIEGENFWRHHKTISPGLQEYIEALSFSYFLEHKALISYQTVQEDLKTAEGVPLFPLGIPYTDYVLGVSDLTGELMRFAITSIGRLGLTSQSSLNIMSVCNFVRACRADWEPMTPYIAELKSKQEATTNSLRKIEEVLYAVAIRGLEKSQLYGQSGHFHTVCYGDDSNDDSNEVDGTVNVQAKL